MATTTTQTTSFPSPSGYGETKRSKGRVGIALTAFVAIMAKCCPALALLDLDSQPSCYQV